MRQWDVYVEGKSDRHFLSCIADHIKMRGLAWQVIGGGVSSLPTMQQAMLENHHAGNRIAVIVDANTNVAVQRRELRSKIQQIGIPTRIETFLLPNNSDSGCLETLLEAMAVGPHRVIYDCLDAYGRCVRSHSPKYHLPDVKARIYAYCEALGIKTAATERDYSDSDHWNLNAPALGPLTDFLRTLRY